MFGAGDVADREGCCLKSVFRILALKRAEGRENSSMEKIKCMPAPKAKAKAMNEIIE